MNLNRFQQKISLNAGRKNMALKEEKSAIFPNKVSWLGLKISEKVLRPFLGKQSKPEKLSELRSFFGSASQCLKFVTIFKTSFSLLRLLLSKIGISIATITKTNGNIFEYYRSKKKKEGKQEPILNIQKPNCMKCRNAHIEGHLKVCPAK